MPIRHREAFKGAVLAARGIRMPFRHWEAELCLISTPRDPVVGSGRTSVCGCFLAAASQ